MIAYQQLQTRLQAAPATWLVTGVAGFIGFNLLEALRSNWTLTPINRNTCCPRLRATSAFSLV
jgi:nucleoside-diphosphate-sugar epimerase